jgi:hypothetical protein
VDYTAMLFIIILQWALLLFIYGLFAINVYIVGIPAMPFIIAEVTGILNPSFFGCIVAFNVGEVVFPLVENLV